MVNLSAQRGANWAKAKSRNGSAAGSARGDSGEDSDYEELLIEVENEMETVREGALELRARLSSLDQANDDDESCGCLHPVHAFCKRIEKSAKFMFLVATVILMNVVSMTFEADNPHYDVGKDCSMECIAAVDRNSSATLGCPEGCGGDSDFWLWVNHAFLVFFTVELVIRVFAFGSFCAFFCDTNGDQGWNVFDFTVVGTCWMMWYFQAAHIHGGKYMNLLRSLRMLRMLRVLRIFRVPLFKKLNIIVQGLIESIPSGFWIGCMLGGVMFVSAIFCTDLIGHQADDWPVEERDNIKQWFGTIGKSMLTLFQFLTLADWSAITRVVTKQSSEMMYFFLLYVIFAAMVILSLLTGVLADHINTVTTEAEEEEKAEKQKTRKQALATEFKAFKKATAGKDGTDHCMSKQEFRDTILDKEMKEELNDLGIDLDTFESDDLFRCFDRSANGVLCFHEFQEGMEELRVGVTGKQVFKLEVSLRNAVRHCDPQQEFVQDAALTKAVKAQLGVANTRVASINVQLESLIEELANFSLPKNTKAASKFC
mmetsp:Transcript_69973/g.177590  ORF Transcript_69973/g.177590 Transcript_69973/m.177590 type:complete len:541 (-) Transcript_69973:65-1687(-)